MSQKSQAGKPAQEATSNQLASFIRQRMKSMAWSQRETAQCADISAAALSRLLNGQVVPRAETLKSLAVALQVDDADLLHLAGYIDKIPTDHLDPSAAQLAKRLTDLPPHVRELAIRAMDTTLDVITASAGTMVNQASVRT